jgi:hypothetical protein
MIVNIIPFESNWFMIAGTRAAVENYLLPVESIFVLTLSP